MARRYLDDEVPSRVQVGDAGRASRSVLLSSSSSLHLSLMADSQLYLLILSHSYACTDLINFLRRSKQLTNEPLTPPDSDKSSPAPKPNNQNTSETSNLPGSSKSGRRRRLLPLLSSEEEEAPNCRRRPVEQRRGKARGRGSTTSGVRRGRDRDRGSRRRRLLGGRMGRRSWWGCWTVYSDGRPEALFVDAAAH
jgi:hypothetical protein